MALHLGDRTVELRWLGRGHTAGDIVAWLPEERILFSGDLVESEAALYTGDAHVEDWRSGTLDALAALKPRALVPGRGAVVHGDDVARAIEQTRGFLNTLRDEVAAARASGIGLKGTFDSVHERMARRYGDWPIFEHCMPFNVKRMADELEGRDPVIWTAETDAQIWERLQS
jgi:glyoxylase-like metal-dependent hydrolase (beta-lactamase superfamily II)